MCDRWSEYVMIEPKVGRASVYWDENPTKPKMSRQKRTVFWNKRNTHYIFKYESVNDKNLVDSIILPAFDRFRAEDLELTKSACIFASKNKHQMQ